MTPIRLSLLLLALTCARVASAQVPPPTQGDFVIENFRFPSGETLPELRLHYRTLGKPEPTLAASDAALDAAVASSLRSSDANDLLYQLEASRDYDPGPDLEKVRAPLLAVNSADDLINPPELGILEREIKRIHRAKAVVLPTSDATRGHGTHTIAAIWKHLLGELLTGSAK